MSDHKHDHHHDHTSANLPVHATEKTWSNAWKNMAQDIKARLQDGIDPHAIPTEHDGHIHDNIKVDTVAKVGIILGSTAMLGVVIHGLHTIKRGLKGWEDKEIGEQHAPSVQYTVVGAAEVVGGLALMKRLLTGTYKFF